jgi:hypothetical protein
MRDSSREEREAEPTTIEATEKVEVLVTLVVAAAEQRLKKSLYEGHGF